MKFIVKRADRMRFIYTKNSSVILIRRHRNDKLDVDECTRVGPHFKICEECYHRAITQPTLSDASCSWKILVGRKWKEDKDKVGPFLERRTTSHDVWNIYGEKRNRRVITELKLFPKRLVRLITMRLDL
ncbi:hypothetical protein V1478_005981 [Vespula squamosa]|uniref:Uncharacterized protein n=1 Tax=Vespula squamosa TaxID=30214 RepID=A0ABD2B8W8_VESSQ